MNSRVAVVSESLFMAELIIITSANVPIIMPHISPLLVAIAIMRLGELATPYAVMPVIERASVIHMYTLRISAGKAADNDSSLSCDE